MLYHITDSVASSIYGNFRTTEDVDVVIDLPPWKVKEFCAKFPDPEWYADEFAASGAVERQGMFNIIHNPTGFKVDVIAVKDAPYHELRVTRARAVAVLGDRTVRFSTVEDVVLSKLEFYREGQSEKHVRDIAKMHEFGGGNWDLAYLEMWAVRIGVRAEWETVKQRLSIATRPGAQLIPIRLRYSARNLSETNTTSPQSYFRLLS